MFNITTGLVIFLIVELASSQLLDDPITNFCRRFAHQTTVIDNKLYIDGGLVDYGGSIDSSTINHTNSYLLYADLSKVNNNSFPVQYDDLPKPSNVPSVQGGALWADQANKLFYLFGGEYNWTTPPPTRYTLWSFDVIYETWNATEPDLSSGLVSPPSFGASAVDDNRGIAYYYGGWSSNASELGFNGDATVQSSLITYDMDNNNLKVSVFIDDTPRAEGALFYIPASDKGMLVYFGGIQNTSNSSTATGVPMDTVYLFDIGSGAFFSQKTSGSPPGMRRRFCGGASWPDDRSSYNIYIYGGAVPYDEEGFGFNDVWILSIPSFTWTMWFNSTENAHHSVSCNIVNEGQMIIMGGWFPDSKNKACDVPHIWGQHNLNLGMDNVLGAHWYQYLPNLTDYTVPPNVTEVIGGSGTGGATLTTPLGGFVNDDLRTYLGRLAPTGSRTATRDLSTATPTHPSNGKSHVGAIAGGVLGGLAALILILLLALFCLRRRKRAQAATTPSTSSPSAHRPPSSHTDKPSPDLPHDNQRAIFTTNSHKHSPSSQTSSSQQGHSPPPPPPPPSWQPIPVEYIPQYQQRFIEDLPQQHYPPPPPPIIPYYPPPGLPQQYEPITPTYEMPNVRSPANANVNAVGGGGGGDSGGGAGRLLGGGGGRRTGNAHERINEE